MAGQSAQGCNFPSSQRLHRPSEFAVVLPSKVRIYRECFELRIGVNNRSTEAPTRLARLGLVIPKRFAKQAVLRNLLKRLAREAFRHAKPELPPVDVVLRLTRPPLRSGTRVDPECRQHWRRTLDALFAGVVKC